MKKIIIILAVVLFGTACEEGFLDEKPRSFSAPENTFTSTKGFETALTGLMWIVREDFGNASTMVLWFGTDMARQTWKTNAGYNDAELLQEHTNDWIMSHRIWDRCYAIIANANQIIAQADNEGIDWETPEDKTRIISQARFVRAYYYEHLLTLFGDLPFVTEPVKPFRLDFTRTPVSEIHDFILKELKDIVPLLPDEVAPEKDGTPNKGAAQYLLTQVYLHLGMNSEAEATAQALINSRTYKLMTERFGPNAAKPGDVFSDMFLENNQNRSSGNLESIWCIQYQYQVTGDGWNYNKRMWVAQYYDTPGIIICDSFGGRGRAYVAPCTWLLDSYESQDMRGSRYNVRKDYYYNDPHPRYADIYGTKVPDSIYNFFMYDFRLMHTTRKWDYGTSSGNPTSAACGKEIMVYRLAGVYLMLAEAQFKQDNPEGAATSLNVVRSRVNASPVTAGDVDLDYILDEYARELLAEYPTRRYTLLRTGQLSHRIQKHRTLTDAGEEDFWNVFDPARDVLWPIPQVVIDANLDAEIVQNPGYN